MNIRLVLLSIGAGVLALGLTGCGENPDVVVKNWHAAIMNCDLEMANQYADAAAAKGNAGVIAVVKDFKLRAVSDLAAQKSLRQLGGMTFSAAKTNGDIAVVRASIEGDGQEGVLTLKKIGGKWKISDFK